MERPDWLRTVLYHAFIVVFSAVMYTSFDKLFTRNTAFSQVQRTARKVQYPSLTMCHGYSEYANVSIVFKYAPGTLAAHVVSAL